MITEVIVYDHAAAAGHAACKAACLHACLPVDREHTWLCGACQQAGGPIGLVYPVPRTHCTRCGAEVVAVSHQPCRELRPTGAAAA